jgi:pimeloyl-ACP methyl ester carboxylesterase
MRPFHRLLILVALVGVAGCKRQSAEGPGAQPSPPPVAATTQPAETPASAANAMSLTEARRGFQTHLAQELSDGGLAPLPPLELFRLVTYSAASRLPAYVSLDPKPGVKHPAIIWLLGGFSNSIGEIAWTPGPPDNDQSAGAYREAGIVMMYPALRGGNDSTAFKEGFYGEVDDVLAAADYLRKVDYVDPERIYLGGHSTGGTLALLAAESTDRFRAVFSFGPVDDVGGYGGKVLPFDMSDPKELELRAPGRFLQGIRGTTFVFEGTSGRSNILSLRMMMRLRHPDSVHFYPVSGVDHFAILHPLNRLIAQKILADSGPKTNISFSEQELSIKPAP